MRGRVVMVISLLGDVPKRSQPGKVGELMAWQDAHRRRSLVQIGASAVRVLRWCLPDDSTSFWSFPVEQLLY